MLNEARTLALKIVNDNCDEALTKLAKDALTYEKTWGDETDAQKEAYRTAAWAKVDVKAKLIAAINEDYAEEAKGNAFTNYDAAGKDAAKYAAKVFGISTKDADSGDAVIVLDKLIAKIKTDLGDYAALNAYNADRDELLAALDNVDYSQYSSTEVNKDGITYLAEAQQKIAEAKKTAATKNAYTIDDIKGSDPAASGLSAKLTEIEDWLKTVVEAETYPGTEIENGLYLVKDVKTNDKLAEDAIKDGATKASLKAAVQKNYADYITGASPDKELAEAYLTIYNYLIDADIVTEVGNIEAVAAATNSKETAWKDVVKSIAGLETYATKYKAEKDATGQLVREAAAVDKIVAEATKYLYATTEDSTYASSHDTAPYKSISDAEKAIANLYTEKVVYDLNFAKEAAKAAAQDAYDSVIDDYYPLEAAKVESNLADMLAAIEAADTEAKIQTALGVSEAVGSALKEADPSTKSKAAASAIGDKLTNGIDKDTTVDGKVTFSGDVAADVLDAVKKYLDYVNTGKTILDDSYILKDASVQDIKDAICEIYGEAGARTEAERKAVSIDPAAIAAKLSTVGALAAAKTAAEEAIKALPVTITLADKDAVAAAYKLFKAYDGMTGKGTLSNETTLTAAITALQTKMANDFIIRSASVDKSDKAALKALQAEISEASGLSMFSSSTPFESSKKIVDNALKAIRDKEKKAVEDAINAIPVNVTDADAATVKNARALYDAYVAEYTDYSDAYVNADDPTKEFTNYRDLASAEAILGLTTTPGQSVEAIKIVKVHSKAAKGKMTIMWTVEGDLTNVQKLQVYRSTKANSGYKRIISCRPTATQYTNTKSLKKGTKYYYKVRAYAEIDGVKYYSDWSNKAYRKAK